MSSRDVPCLAFLAWGLCLALLNVLGAAGMPLGRPEDYDRFLDVGLGVGLLSVFGGLWQACVDESLADRRPGLAGETAIVGSYALWGLATLWLCGRLGAGHGLLPGLPEAFEVLDPVLCLLCAGGFVFGALAPLATLQAYSEAPRGALSSVEGYRMRGLVACGLPGALYLVDAASFALGGSPWWARVCEAWPAQRPCEQTTLLCGTLAVEGCMLLHRLGREGAVRFRGEAVPVGIALSVLLTLVPTAGQIYWHRADISLWEFYFV